MMNLGTSLAMALPAELPILVIAVVILFLVMMIFYFVPVRLWVAAWSAGAHVSIMKLIAMRLRRVRPTDIVEPFISAVKAGLDVTTDQLESHLLAGGRVQAVVNALISASKANIALEFNRAAAIDLAGRDVFHAVQMSVNPKIITTPKIAAIAKDGIQVMAITRVTVRANLDKLVGGAGEETIIARVGEGVVTTIGSSASHKEVLENPDRISRMVLSKGLDTGTAFEILSLDIADVDVGANIGAKLQAEQAEADKQIAQAKAESRRAMAVAQEQEMKARVHEMRAEVIKAEAEVPRALAAALRDGNMGVMDYMAYQNIKADTQMRDGISHVTTPDKTEK